MADNQAYELESESGTSISDNNGVTFGTNRNAIQMNETGPYAGMPKEVLLKYSRQKHFVWARNILTAAVILTILALLSMIIALIAVSPACQHFYQTSPIYQIYPKSFKDSDNDGYGDLKGIQGKLSYLKDDLGVSSVWLNPIYTSPQADNGYDIEDYRSIDKMYGTMEDFEDLLAELHNNNMRLIMDFVPNHTSNNHTWFLASSDPSHTDYEKYKDYYVWVNSTDGTKDGIPNNWQSVFSDVEPSAWEWNPKRQQFYYHAFLKEQPDLNLRNKDVLNELENVLIYWMEHGVDGFRVDAIKFMLEATHLRDNPCKDPSQNASYENMYGDYTENQPGLHDIVASWRVLLKKYSTEPGVYRFMEAEVYDDNLDYIIRYYGTPWQEEADFPMNFQLIELGNETQAWTGTNIEQTVLTWMRKMPSNKWPNWVLGNHDNSRLVSRLGPDRARCASFLSMTLSGTPGMYYGEEIGMTDNNMANTGVSNAQQDFRDPERTPMQWSTEENAGFCSNCTPWLNVNPNFEDSSGSINVETQKALSGSIFDLYKRLIALRSDVTFLRGWLCMIKSTTKSIIFVREMSGTQSYLVAINFDESSPDTIDLKADFDNSIPSSGGYIASTDFEEMDGVPLNPLELKPGTGIVATFKPGAAKNYFNQRLDMNGRCFNPRKVCVNVIGLLEVC